MASSSRFPRKYAFSILTVIALCSVAINSGCNSYAKKQDDQPNTVEVAQAAVKKPHDRPNTAEGTAAAVKEIVAVVEKSLADLPPPVSAPAVCADEMTKLKEVFKTAPGTEDAAKANSALLRCTSSATNLTRCKGKPQPCGVVYYNSPIKPPDPAHPDPEPSRPTAVDVSAPDQIAAACREIAGGLPDATGAILGSVVGNYSCGAWFKAAANNDPTLLIAPGFVPTIQLMRDLKTYANGVVDAKTEAVLADSVKHADWAMVVILVGGTFVPIEVLPADSGGGTPGQVLDGAHETVRQRVKQTGKAVRDGCKAAGICH